MKVMSLLAVVADDRVVSAMIVLALILLTVMVRKESKTFPNVH